MWAPVVRLALVGVGLALFTASVCPIVQLWTRLTEEVHEPTQLSDLTNFDLAKAGMKLVKPMKDSKTGFTVGGVNDTQLIKKLTHLNNRTIAELEKDMRPGALSEKFEGSSKGFLGPSEKLLDVLVADNQYVVDELGLTHQELAKHLHALGAIRRHLGRPGEPGRFIYHGRRFEVKVIMTKGLQASPFLDGTQSGSNAFVHNLDNDKKLEYALLVPYLIERWGFYEGQGTPYRIEPRKALEVLDFLKTNKK